MDYIICIPSYKRFKSLQKHTLQMLQDNNIPNEKIKIYVAPEDYEEYKGLEDKYKIVVGEKGINNQRHFILNDNIGENVVMIDDDILYLLRKDENREKKFFNLEEIIIKGFEECKKEGTKLWGVYPASNGYFMRETITTDLKFIIGTLQGIINDDDKHKLDWYCDQCEDYARSIHYYLLYGKVVRINYICPESRYYLEPGGLQSIYTKEERRLIAETKFKELANKYPHLCRFYTKKDGLANIRLHHYKNKKSISSVPEVLPSSLSST